MDTNYSTHAKTPAYHVILLSTYVYMHVRAHTYVCVCIHMIKMQGNQLCYVLHSRNTPTLLKSAFLSLNLPHELVSNQKFYVLVV